MTDDEKAILQFEGQWWQLRGHKEEAIRERFGLSPVRYYQVLTRLLDDPKALAFDPLLTRRLLRIRDARARQRSEMQ